MPRAAEGVKIPPLRRIPSCTLPGAWQMAIDAWLLERVILGERQGPLLRFYRWSGPTLSLGRNQRSVDPRWLSLAQAGSLSLVRRPSGGAAVLHGGDLTYALLWPGAPRRRRQAYHLSCRWLQHAFAAMGLPLVFGVAPSRSDQPSCFATSTTADLVHPDGGKRIGSAQFWRGSTLLQHGSVAIEPDAVLWEAVFDTPPPALPRLPLAGEELEAHLLASAQCWLPLVTGEGVCSSPVAPVVCEPLAEWEWTSIGTTLERYEVRAFTGNGCEASSRDLATGSRARPSG